MTITLTATGRNPSFGGSHPDADLFALVTASGDNADLLTFTVTNVTNGADEKLKINGTLVDLVDSNDVAVTGDFLVDVALSGTTATVTIETPPAGITSAQLQTLIDTLVYQNSNATPGTALRQVTLTGVSAVGDPGTQSLSLTSFANPPNVLELVTVSSNGVQITSSPNLIVDSFSSVSLDGRYVVFTGSDPNLVAGDTNGSNDIYLRDRLDGTTTRVNLASNGSQAGVGTFSGLPSISDDGRYVAFITSAQLVPEDSVSNSSDLYVRDLLNNSTFRVSVGTGGIEANATNRDGEISGNGQFAVFTSFANNLAGAGNDLNQAFDVFVRNIAANTTERVTVGIGGTDSNGESIKAAISTDGTKVAFESDATNLVASDINGIRDIFLRNTTTDTTVLVSVATDGTQANDVSSNASISADGTKVAFMSKATNLVAGGDPNGGTVDIYVRDLTAGTTIRITGASLPPTGDSEFPSMSADGRFVTFQNSGKIWVYDIQTDHLSQLSGTSAGNMPVISDDGSTIVFFTGTNLVPYDTNTPFTIQDIYAAPSNFNEPPTLDLDASNNNPPATGFSANYTEGNVLGVLIADTDVQITDDTGNIQSATIAVQIPVADDELTLGNQAGFAITGSGTATITITGNGTVDEYEDIIEQIRFRNTGDDPAVGGTRPTRSINSAVNDGTSNSPTAITTVNITGTNDQPTLTATGADPTFVENGPAVDLYNGVTASTIEAGGEHFTSLKLTVSNVTDGSTAGQDEILIINGVDVPLSTGGPISLGATAGTATVSLDTTTDVATVTITGANLTSAEFQTLIDDQLTYRNINDTPSLDSRTITITQVSDSGLNAPPPNDNTADLNIVSTVSVVDTNDQPNADITPASLGPVDEQTPLDLKNNGLSVSDPDSEGGVEMVTLSVDEAEGKLTVTAGTSGATVQNSDSSSVTITGTIAQINALLNTDLTSVVSYTDDSNTPLANVTLRLHIDDQGNSSLPPLNQLIDDDTATISINAVNDPPEITSPDHYQGLPNTAITIDNITFADADEGVGGVEIATFTAPAGTFTAADGFNVIVGGSGSSLTLTGTTADLTNFIANGQLTYTVDTPQTITVTLDDQGNTGTGGAKDDTVHIQVILGDSPDIIDLGGDTATFTEGGAPVLLDDASAPATVTDDDSPNFDTGNLMVSVTGNPVPGEDVVGIMNTDHVSVSGGGDVSVDSGSGFVVIGTVAGGSDLVVTFNANATPAATGFLINALTYFNSNNTDPSPSPRTIAVTISDGDGTSSSQDVLVNVIPVNDAPTLQNLTGDNATFTEHDSAVNLDLAGDAAVNDIDSNDFDTGSLTVAITSGKVAAEDELLIDQTGALSVVASRGSPKLLVNGTQIGTLFSTGGAGGGDLVINFNSNATPTSVAELIHAIQYFNSGSDAPTAGIRGLTFTLVDGDGQANGGTDAATVNTAVTVNAVNDAPVPGFSNTNYAATEQVALDLKGDGPAVSDIDAGGGDLTVTLSADYGILTATEGASGATIVSGSGTDTLIVEGTEAELAALFNSDATSTLTYLADTDTPPASATLSLEVHDNGNTGSGGDLFDTATATIDITAVNDPGTAADDAFSTNEATNVTGDVFAANPAIADSDDNPLTVVKVNGSKADVGNQITLSSGALLMVNADGTFLYEPNGVFDDLPAAGSGASNLTATDSFTYKLTGGSTATVTVTIFGLDSDDKLRGTSGVDVLNGGIGTDTLFGKGGDDTLNGGGGADQMEGGRGSDTYIVHSSSDTVLELAGSANGTADTVMSSVSFSLGGLFVENLTLTGDADINAYGNFADNVLIGNRGDNKLDGNGGADHMEGKDGNDSYFVDDAGDTVIENGGAAAGTADRVVSSVSFALGGTNVEILRLIGNADLIGTGNFAENILIGNRGDNKLNGNGGADHMEGRGGNDSYFVDDAGDTVVENGGAAAGTADRVVSSVDFSLGGTNVENLTLTGHDDLTGTGNFADNVIKGNVGRNILIGHQGDDALTGNGGDDVFRFFDGDGNDTVTDFADGIEKFDMRAVSSVDHFNDVVITDSPAGVTVDYGTGSFVVANLTTGIGPGDFIF